MKSGAEKGFLSFRPTFFYRQTAQKCPFAVVLPCFEEEKVDR